jgi:hypothetical protein
MTVAEGVGNVLDRHGSRLLEPVAADAGIPASPAGLLLEERGDGSAEVCHRLATAGRISDGLLR